MSKYIDNFNYELLKKIGSPCNKFRVDFVLKEIDTETMKGKNLILYEKYQKVYCDDGLSSNFIVPFVDYSFNKDFKTKHIRDLTIINNPYDAERITENHVKKMANLKYQSLEHLKFFLKKPGLV